MPRQVLACGEQHIGRFQVAMHDAGVVGVLDRSGELLDQPGRLARRLRDAGEELLEAAALDQLQRQIRQPLVLAHIVDADDSRVRQPGHRRRLDAETPQLLAPGMRPARIIFKATTRPRRRCLAL